MNLFSGRVSTQGGDNDYGSARLEGEGPEALEKFRMILQRDRIRAAAKSQLHKGIEGTKIIIFLNKQVAYAGHVSFSEPEGESPLGPLRVIIESENPMEVIDWLTQGGDKRSRK